MTIRISYDDIVTFHNANLEVFKKLAYDTEGLIAEGRERYEVPLYVTRARIKTPESAYLKTKRKAINDLSNIKDWVGLRVLCLFEQDILPVYRFLLRLLLGFHKTPGKDKRYVLAEIKLFNWSNRTVEDHLVPLIRSVFREGNITATVDRPSQRLSDSRDQENAITRRVVHYQIEHKPFHLALEHQQKENRYRSIHFVANEISGSKEIPLEIQLRTLLEDVWGEIEHSLAYKQGNIHPHIHTSFRLLATELRAKDEMMGHLRSIRDQETSVEQFSATKSGPKEWMHHDSEVATEVFDTDELRNLNSQYCAHFLENNNRMARTAKWREKARALHKQIVDALAVRPATKNSQFWACVEDAFLYFCEGKLQDAARLYTTQLSMLDAQDERWVVHYRLGEVLYAQGKIEQALIQFDKCEDILARKSNSARVRDIYFAKSKLANVYWSLGPEFIATAVDKIREVETLFYANEDAFEPDRDDREMSLLNNLCYYYLEWFATLGNGDNQNLRYDVGAAAEKYFKSLRDFVSEHKTTAGASNYDTLAWYCFQKYKQILSMENQDDQAAFEQLALAKQFIGLIDTDARRSSEGSVSILTSGNLQRRHIQDIMIEIDKVERLGLHDFKKN
ncbi:MAG: hypothetical protein HY017_25235 [Betaproteobacteria bacterium]|nr:hypothetical protein [Betaproteobacteria bacterium]